MRGGGSRKQTSCRPAPQRPRLERRERSRQRAVRWKSCLRGQPISFSEEMLALLKTRDWEACHRRIDREQPGEAREARVSIAPWRSTVFEWQGRYDDALGTLDAGRA